MNKIYYNPFLKIKNESSADDFEEAQTMLKVASLVLNNDGTGIIEYFGLIDGTSDHEISQSDFWQLYL